MDFWSNLTMFFELIGNYGLPMVISGVAIYLFIYWFKQKNGSTKTEQKKIDEELPRVTDRDIKIRQLLLELLLEVGADRTYVFQYHNSGVFRSGIGYLKASNTHEVVSRGTSPQIQILQNLPISMFALWNKKILNHEFIVYDDLDKVRVEDMATYESFCDQGIQSVYSIGLYDITDKPMGFIGVDFNRTQTTLSKDKLDEIIDKSYKIAGLLYV